MPCNLLTKIYQLRKTKMTEKVIWCKNCLSMSTRNRISFDTRGFCNACVWSEKKKTLDWNAREKQLVELLAQHKRTDGYFDCVVPVSGGKDGSYVAHNLKYKYGMNPLCVTVSPALPSELGNLNLRSFIASGFNHIQINPNPQAMQMMNKTGLIEMGFPYYGWLIAIYTAPIRIAQNFGINLIFYGEDGEVEYGGSDEKDDPIFDTKYVKEKYFEGGFSKVLDACDISNEEKVFFRFPENLSKDINLTHWSYFENWDPYRNYLTAKENCGLQEAEQVNSGTFTNFSQNDQALYPLHTYLMYLKFGFGRANQDACIDIRRGAMDRDQAMNLVNMYDGQYPEELMDTYLDYYKMDKDMFDQTLDKWANTKLFKKTGGRWLPEFRIS